MMNGTKKRLSYWILCVFCLSLLAACTTSQPGDGGTAVGGTNSTVTPTATSGGAKTTIPAEAFRAIRFVDHTYGWALTMDKVLRTADGGKTWVDMTKGGLSASELAGGKTAQAVFQTANRAWVFITTPKTPAGITVHIWRTDDGGGNWYSASFDDNEAIGFADRPTFINIQDGWVLLGTGAGAGSYGVHLYQTKDGGASWKQISAAPGTLPLSGEKAGPSFTDATTGWMADHVAALDNAPLLYDSIDGGISWAKEPLPLISSYAEAHYRTTPPVTFDQVLIEPVHVSNGTQKHLVMYVSGNGGAHWYPGQPAAFDTDNVYVIDDQGHWVAIDSGTVYRQDGKGNWVKAGTVPATAGPMSFINAQEGWSLDTQSAALYHTTNGGTSWETINYNFVSAS